MGKRTDNGKSKRMDRKQLGLTLFSLFLCVILFAGEAAYQEGQLIIQLKKDAKVSDLITQYSDQNVEVVKPLSKSMNIWLIRHDGPSKALLRKVKKNLDVNVVQLNHKVEMRLTPNDPGFSTQQWNMFNNGGGSGSVADADIDADLAWDVTTGGPSFYGDTPVVAVIDGRFDLGHEDIQFLKNYDEIPNDGIDNDNNGYIDDYDGWNAYQSNGDVQATFGSHGTHVAGIVGAIGNNSIGVAGVNWNVPILPIVGNSTVESEVVEAYSYVVDIRSEYNNSFGTKGAFIVATNSSFGVDFAQPSNFPIWCNMYDTMGALGILSAGATINSAVDVDAVGDVPTACASDHLISVTNTNHADILNTGAGYGATQIDIGAPGTAVYSTLIGDNYGDNSGTSMATPHIAGAISLMMSVDCQGFMDEYFNDPPGTMLLLKDYLLTSVDKIPALESITVSEGRLNLFKSVRLMKNFDCNACGFTVSSNVNNVSCFGADDATIEVTPQGNPGDYTYMWSHSFNNTRLETNLISGAYTVTITDSAGCEREQLFFIEEPDAITFENVSVVHETSNSKGSFSFDAVGGAGEFEFSLDNNIWQTVSFFGNLDAGNYTLYARDSSGCVRDTTIEVKLNSSINEAELINISIYPTLVSSNLNIQVNGNETFDLNMYSSLGELIFVKRVDQNESLDLNHLAKGVYLLTVSNQFNQQQTVKLTKL